MIFKILLVILAYFFCGSMTILLIQWACRHKFVDEFFYEIDLKDNNDVGTAVLLWPFILTGLLLTCIPAMIGKGMLIMITAISYTIKAIFVRDSEEKEEENNE